MPTLFKMSDEKEVTETPAAVVISGTAEPRVKKTKRYAIIAVSAILGAAIVLTAILVGMYIFTESQREIIKYSLEFNKNVKQDVEADPNTNIVQYHVKQDGHEAWIINDFNKDIQVVKIQTDKDTVCYMNALNRSAAADPTQVAKPTARGPTDMSESATLTYVTSNTPVGDTSFLSKAARDLCKGISVYWVYPHCAEKTPGLPLNVTDAPSKTKRQSTPSCAYVFYAAYGSYYVPCVQMCCRTICACSIRYQCTVDIYRRVVCTWYYSNCPSAGIYSNPLYDQCTSGPSGYICPNRNPRTWPTC